MESFIFRILFFSTLLIPFEVPAQLQWKSSKDKIVIPFELTHNLIMVDITLNGVALKMVVDTGSENNIIFSFPDEEIDFGNTRKMTLRGLGHGETLEAYISVGNFFEIDKLSDSNFNVLLIMNQDIGIVNQLGVPINGILGVSFFKDFIVEINYAKRKLYIHKSRGDVFPKKVKKYDSIPVLFSDSKPFVTLDVALKNRTQKEEVSLLFDSGLGDGLWLFENDTITCEENFFIDVLGKGISGDIKGKKSRVETLKIHDFKLKEALVSYPDSISIAQVFSPHKRHGSLGGGIIKRFNWFLDYEKQVFYLKKNKYYSEPFHYNMSGISVQHAGIEWIKEVSNKNALSFVKVDESSFMKREENYKFTLKPIFIIYAVRENSPAEKAGLKVGDRILSINNKRGYYYTIQKITDLFQSEEGKKIKMKVERNGLEFEYEFYLEKVL